MKEILFRGKRLDNGRWVYGYYIFDPQDETAYIYYLNTHPCGHCLIYCKVDPTTVGQYVGLPDKDDRRIFEGDIVKVSSGYCGNPYYPTSVRVEAVEYNPKLCEYPFYRWSGDIYEVEVIGNIYDNPALLKGQDE